MLTPKYNLSKIGLFMYNLCVSWTQFLIKHRVLYYFLAIVWGTLMTVVGGIISIALCAIGNKPISYYWIYYHAIKKNWGGFEMGLMFVRDTTSGSSVSAHEFGHTFQNCLFGPFMLILVSGPSCIRYWIREIKYRKGISVTTPYDAIWFEAAATDCGLFAIDYLQKKND